MTNCARLRDGHGKPIPKRLADPFRNRAILLNFVSRLQKWETSLRKNAKKPGGESIDMEAIRRHACVIQQILSCSVPYELCEPECDPKQWLSLAESNAAGRYVLPERS